MYFCARLHSLTTKPLHEWVALGTVRAVVYGVHVRLNSPFSHDFNSFYVECMEQHALDGVNLEILFLF